jgi:hypothetical protein
VSVFDPTGRIAITLNREKAMINLQPHIVRRGLVRGLALFTLIAFMPGLASAQSLTSAVVYPTTVVNGTPSIGTVTLSAPASAGGAFVSLSSSNPAAVTRPVVLVPQGATSAQFVVDTLAVAVSTPVTIDATFNGVAFSPTLTVTPRVPVRGVSGDLWADVVIGQPDFSQVTMHEVTSTRLFSPGGSSWIGRCGPTAFTSTTVATTASSA